MNKNKKFYSQPEAELLVVRFEQNIMSPGINAAGLQDGNIVDADDYGFSDWD